MAHEGKMLVSRLTFVPGMANGVMSAAESLHVRYQSNSAKWFPTALLFITWILYSSLDDGF